MPGRHCCVKNCSSYSHDRRSKRRDDGLRYFGFPKWKTLEGDQMSGVTWRRRMAWLAAVKLKDITFENIPRWMRVCSLHFHGGKPSYEMFENHPDWAPSLRLGHDVKETDKVRFQRHADRQARRASQQPDGLQQPPPPAQHQEESLPLQHQHQQPVEECALCTSRREVINSLLEENKQLREELKEYRMKEQFLSGDDNSYVMFQTLSTFTS